MGEADDTGCHDGLSSTFRRQFPEAMAFASSGGISAELWSLSWGISKAGDRKTWRFQALCFAFGTSFGLNCGHLNTDGNSEGPTPQTGP
jgi:hypothetical protein